MAAEDAADRSAAQAEQALRQVDAVKEVMRKNIDEMGRRGDALSDLESRAGRCGFLTAVAGLRGTAAAFKSTATQAKRRAWWNMARWVILSIVALAGILALVLVVRQIKN